MDRSEICRLIPDERLPSPNPVFSFQYYLRQLPPRSGAAPPVKITPASLTAPSLTPLEAKRPTQVMAILNVTPDSFSDGGVHSGENLEAIATTVRNFISSGATIIDVGGQSTRPGATTLNDDDEIARVVPVIKQIRSMPEAANVAISIDTFRARVAEEAVRAGADIINDVSGGMLDEDMFLTAARLGKTIILMHMRGTPETMNSMTDYPEGIIKCVGKELLERVQAAEKAGIRRWRIILDPGIGFAKNQNQNLELLRWMQELRDFEGLKGYPWLVGTSRKSFIGRITGVEKPDERTWGTAATVAESVRAGADIIRVHDVAEMAKVVKMADAIWRAEEVRPTEKRAELQSDEGDFTYEMGDEESSLESVSDDSSQSRTS
jgi:2-amino-4-hydroxy-6-hydroxymethyldihydropteridine diphosphokinase / dihydropteroate synthase